MTAVDSSKMSVGLYAMDKRPDTDKIRLMIVDGNLETLNAMRSLLSFETDIEVVATASTRIDAVQSMERMRPNLILIDLSSLGHEGLLIAENVASHLHGTPVVVVLPTGQANAEYLARAMQAGAREFLVRPFGADDLTGSVRRVHQRRNQALALGSHSTEPPTTASHPGTGAGWAGGQTAAPEKHGQIFAICGANGGLGRSTLAVNLAVALKNGSNNSVALVDCSLRFGDIGVLLNIRSSRSISDLCSAGGNVDLDILPDVLANHPTGVRVLLAPSAPELADVVTPRAIGLILAKLRTQFDYVIVDTSTSLDETILTVLDTADRILLLTTGEVPAIKNAKLFFEVVEMLNYPPQKTLLVVNQYNPKGRVAVKEIETNIGHPVFALVDRDDNLAIEAAQSGLPFVVGAKSALISQAILRLAGQLVTPVSDHALPSVKRKRGLFR